MLKCLHDLWRNLDPSPALMTHESTREEEINSFTWDDNGLK